MKFYSKHIVAIMFLSMCNFYKYHSVYAKTRIGIVGAGIGGTSTCYFLQDLLGDSVNIDIYESGTVGGRLATHKIDHLEYETGGSIIHEDNLYIQEFMKKFNLEKKESLKSNVANKLGLYDGSEYHFIESSYEWVTVLKILNRYGPINFYNFQSAIGSMLEKFSNIYQLQRNLHSFITLEELIGAMDKSFVSQLKTCARDGMNSTISNLILNELVSAGNLVNYGQTLDNMHEFVTYVSCAGMSGKLFAIKNGNKQIPENLLNICNGNLIKNKVEKIIYDDNSKTYHVHSDRVDNNDLVKEYDYVIIASPLFLSNITFINIEPNNISEDTIPYHVTVTMLVQGALRDEVATDDNINEILMMNNKQKYNSLSLLSSTNGDNSNNVYKIFSTNNELDSEQLNELFKNNHTIKYIKYWHAYPEYDCAGDDGVENSKYDLLSEKTRTTSDNSFEQCNRDENNNCDKFRNTIHKDKKLEKHIFVLHDKMYYVNVIEIAASAMEMSIIGAKNVANLCYKSIIENKQT